MSSATTRRIIARAITTLVHLASDPKTIGMGPTMITPPPLTRVPSSPPGRPARHHHPDEDQEESRQDDRNPCDDEVGHLTLPTAVSYIASAPVRSPTNARVQILREMHDPDGARGRGRRPRLQPSGERSLQVQEVRAGQVHAAPTPELGDRLLTSLLIRIRSGLRRSSVSGP